ncbi:DUF2339 domain-containing protein [Aquimarina sp. 2304DJ70-9]|uniref:DUF2339 domain-containing protein n=1 Tax=Aquimarina penaris TaxID=3231044 RepID=UPI0034628D6A
MEYFLLIVIIIMLLHHKITFKSKISKLYQDIKILQEKLNSIQKSNAEAIGIEKEEKKDTSIPKKPLPKPFSPLTEEKSTQLKTPAESIPKSPSTAETPSPVKKEKELISSDKTAAPTLKKQVAPPKPPKPGLWKRFKEKNPDLEKFIGENLINKLGILILVLGISYFVRYAINKDWINEPARVGIGVLVGSLIIGIAHRLRKKYAAFSSVLVSGGIAVFYFTIAIAFHEYGLFNQTVAFIIMVLITAFSCLISLSYDRIELAILSLIGGFAVPFMISTGSGNYVVLFSYIAILNIGILGLAYFKRWTLVNILAFAFTTILFVGWLIREMGIEEPHYLGALIFAFVFYIIFMSINIINNMRTKGTFSTAQLTVVSINTFVFYTVGMVVLSRYHSEFSGLFTAMLALFNIAFAWFLYKKFGLDKKAVYLLIGLALSFITLAIPIQFKGNYITLFWAAEAVLLMWLGQKSSIKSYRYASILVHILMLFSLSIDWLKLYVLSDEILSVIFNPIFITGVVAIVSLVLVGYVLKNEEKKTSKFILAFNPVIYRKAVIIIAIVISYFVGIFEVGYQSHMYLDSKTYAANTLPVVYHLLFTALLCFFLYRKKKNSNDILINVIAFFNVVTFAFIFSKLPFLEQKENMILEQGGQLAFYFHYVSLGLIAYFFYLIYKTYKRKSTFSKSNRSFMIWGVAFLVVFILSTEVILHGLQIMNLEVTTEQINEYTSNFEESDVAYMRDTLVNTNISEAKYKIIKTGLPVAWGILAFIFLVVGIKRQVKQLRIIALTLLGITILKLFIYDISNVSETGKIIAFILLGVLILVISFVYQKIKRLVIEEDKTAKDEQIN